jgi:hypothetical protein
MVNLMYYFLGASNNVRSREFSSKQLACTFRCNCPFDTDWSFCVSRKPNRPWLDVKGDPYLISCY